MFGDKYSIDKSGQTCFVHFSNIDEMIDFIKQENLFLIYYQTQKELKNLKKKCVIKSDQMTIKHLQMY